MKTGKMLAHKKLAHTKLAQKKLAWIAVLIAGTLACNYVFRTPMPGPPVLEDWPTDTPAALTPTAPAEVPSTAPANRACEPPSAGSFQPPAAFGDYPLAILDFLQGGGMPEALALGLRQAHAASEPIPAAAADMNGDGKLDVAVAVFDPLSQSSPPAGSLLVYTCQSGSYSLAYQKTTQELEGAPHIWQLRDLDANGSSDLLASYETWNASTRFQAVQVLVWNGADFENRLVGDTADLPDPKITVEDAHGAGVYDILVTGTEYGAVGYGPTRPVTHVFSFDRGSQNWIKTEDRKGAADYRIFLVYDADQAAKDGDYPTALHLYQQVTGDTSLQSWLDPASERANLSAYARFKMLAVYAIQGEVGAAKSAMDDLQSGVPSTSPASVFVEMGTLFKKAFPTGGAASGCAAVRDYVTAHSLQVLPLFDYGTANPQYTADDICPWR